MSEENVEIVKHFFEAAEREDWVEVEELFDPDCEIDDFDMPDASGYRGHEGFFEWIAAWDDAWDSWEMNDLEIHLGPNGKLIALFTMAAKGRGSGIELKRRDAMVYEMQGGKITRLGYYNEQQRELALEAAGLSDSQ
jgi:ketosteroid isomerase-like protein